MCGVIRSAEADRLRETIPPAKFLTKLTRHISDPELLYFFVTEVIRTDKDPFALEE
jgi:hypothetical protein